MKDDIIKINTNKKAYFEYFIDKKFECGIQLCGPEIKSIRNRKCSIVDSYVDITDNEVYVIGMNISKFENGNIWNKEEKRPRKLLLHKSEIRELVEWKKDNGNTIVPVEIYIKNGRAKLVIGLAKGKKLYDKRESIKKKDIARETAKELKYVR